MHKLLHIALWSLLLCFSCQSNHTIAWQNMVDSLNEQAYSFRYKQTDSVRAISRVAFVLAEKVGYIDGMAEALNNQMFERFQQMDFDSVMHLAHQINELKPSQVEMLVCDVMQMKVDQRTSDNRSFFIHRSHALKRLSQLQRREGHFTPHVKLRLDYARSELHITASTYFYYVDQRERALSEIHEAEPYSCLSRDTAQWLYYCYMRGSGGLAENTDPEAVAHEEFDYLLKCFTLARYGNYTFFEANSSQSLACMFADSLQRVCVEEYRPDVVHYLTGIFGTDNTAMEMARWALTLFREYDDLYQTACALRTLGELEFDSGNYAEAISFYTSALNCVNFHHDLYYAADSILSGESHGELLPFDPEAGLESVERRWLRQDGVRTVPEWIAGIRQQLSVAYSALNMKQISDFNRNIYLDLLDVTREDAELESRASELQAESQRLHRRLMAVGFVAIGVILLTFWLFRAWRRRGEDENRLLREQFELLQNESNQRSTTLAEEQEMLHEQQMATDLRIQRDKRLNVEKRAKMSLVHGIVPFLDRILHEIKKMQRVGETNERSLSYIRELIQPIMEYNDLLTEWIQVEQGQLSLQLTSFELEPLFASLRQSHFVYEQKGLTLSVEPTHLSVKADKALTLFMLNTLADNARKFTPSGGSVTINAHDVEGPEGNFVELSVSDTGVGLTQEDIDLILNNKVYDAAVIGGTQESQKGFGFGLMNCKGIIEKYRKTNPLFNVCVFGIESRVGQGSRFFFRLPKVITTILAFAFIMQPMKAQTEVQLSATNTEVQTPPEAYVLMDSVYYCNIDGRYTDALLFAQQVIDVLNTTGLEERMEMRPLTDAVAETEWWKRRENLDFTLLLALRNEVAVAALALQDWSLYRMNNRVYKRLYKLLGQDATLETYCQQTERTQQNERLALVAVVLLLVAGMASVYFFWFRPLLARRKSHAELSAQRLEELRAEHEAQHQQNLESIELAEDEHRRRLYEEERLHVQNQIIDNCLSTIKHETMYYPGRILQLAERQPVDLATLNETANYYKDIFTLLSAQGDSQSAALGFRRSRLKYCDIITNLSNRFAAKARRRGLTLQLICRDETNDTLLTADPDLIRVLLDELLDYELFLTSLSSCSPDSSEKTISFTLTGIHDDRFVRFTFVNPAVSLSSERLNNLFMPHRGGIPLLVVKQIIREHDTFMGHPGCRVQAEALPEGGHVIWFTLPISTVSSKSHSIIYF